MNDHPHDREQDDEPLLQHVRQYQSARPSPAVDARILAAADGAKRVRGPSQHSIWQRLRNGMGGASGGRRWSAALGCVALLGLGLGLTLRTLDQVPTGYDAPPARLPHPPSAPMALQAPPSPAEGAVMAEAAEAPRVMARMAAKTAPLSGELRVALRAIADLQARGEGEEAARHIARLKAEHPGLNIEAELGRLGER